MRRGAWSRKERFAGSAPISCRAHIVGVMLLAASLPEASLRFLVALVLAFVTTAISLRLLGTRRGWGRALVSGVVGWGIGGRAVPRRTSRTRPSRAGGGARESCVGALRRVRSDAAGGCIHRAPALGAAFLVVAAVLLVAAESGPSVSSGIGLFEILGYGGLFVGSVLLFRVVAAVARDGTT